MDTITIILIIAIAFLFLELLYTQLKLNKLQIVVARFGTITLANLQAVMRLMEEKEGMSEEHKAELQAVFDKLQAAKEQS
ncbi:hypothetical protein F7R25_03885 [Burkholderia stagnalis]|uniref:Uncharacterized protein n=1 Tax=Burkholderia stagnalis TaxID=1503054 RepID=A0A6L3N2Y7_9BURK|nr:hypothetical protein [Burkholderia stagnalis]KAB0640645.1 hypothetical protein F7R25_03885 [Burkholderia stagnalis]VWB05928.1 hypothetical protein BST28156_00092 [Burkholderia stagnalis]